MLYIDCVQIDQLKRDDKMAPSKPNDEEDYNNVNVSSGNSDDSFSNELEDKSQAMEKNADTKPANSPTKSKSRKLSPDIKPVKAESKQVIQDMFKDRSINITLNHQNTSYSISLKLDHNISSNLSKFIVANNLPSNVERIAQLKLELALNQIENLQVVIKQKSPKYLEFSRKLIDKIQITEEEKTIRTSRSNKELF